MPDEINMQICEDEEQEQLGCSYCTTTGKGVTVHMQFSFKFVCKSCIIDISEAKLSNRFAKVDTGKVDPDPWDKEVKCPLCNNEKSSLEIAPNGQWCCHDCAEELNEFRDRLE